MGNVIKGDFDKDDLRYHLDDNGKIQGIQIGSLSAIAANKNAVVVGKNVEGVIQEPAGLTMPQMEKFCTAWLVLHGAHPERFTKDQLGKFCQKWLAMHGANDE